VKTKVIAEIGINHNGSFEAASRLIDVAADAGCQIAKFQLFSAERLYPRSAGKLDWRDKNNNVYSYDIYEAVKGFELPLQWVDKLQNHCHRRGVEFMASVFDTSGLEFLMLKDVKAIKLSSYTITNIPLIRACAKTGRPIIMSTGGALLGEIETAVHEIFKVHNQLTILHCSIQYPTRLEDCNMGVLDTFSHAFPTIRRGFSDHTREISDAAVQAVYLGASVIEKHITLDKSMKGPDHFFALEPRELIQLVKDVEQAEKRYAMNSFSLDATIYGTSEKQIFEHEKYLRKFAYMSLFTNKDIKKGEQIRREDLSILRPGKKETGLAPEYLDLFSRHRITASHDMECESPLRWDSIL